jgi:hypothetical protein
VKGITVKDWTRVDLDPTLKVPEDYDPADSGKFPMTYSGRSVQKGNTFLIISEGHAFSMNPVDTLGTGTDVKINDLLIARIDTPGQTDANWILAGSIRDQATKTERKEPIMSSQVAAITPGDRHKIYIEELKYSVPDWFLRAVDQWMRYGGEHGRFFSSLLRMDFRGILRHADDVSRETLFGMYKFLHNHIPGNVWGSEKNCKEWSELPENARLEIYERWHKNKANLLDADHPQVLAGTPDIEMYYADKLHQHMKQMIGALMNKLTPDQVAEVLLESRNQFTVDKVNDHLKSITED